MADKKKKSKKKADVDRHGVEKSLPVKVMTKGKYDPAKTGTMAAKNWMLGLQEKEWKGKKIPEDLLSLFPKGEWRKSAITHNKAMDLKKKEQKRSGGSVGRGRGMGAALRGGGIVTKG